jgi:hypothetical protein
MGVCRAERFVLLAVLLGGCATTGVASGPIEESALSDVIEDRIEADARLEGSEIDARTEDGVVYLEGTVREAEDMPIAERIAADARGVVAVLSELRVAGEDEEPRMTPIYDDGVGEYEDSTESMMDPGN